MKELGRGAQPKAGTFASASWTYGIGLKSRVIDRADGASG